MAGTGKILVGKSEEVLKEFADNSVDSCVTDPPYGLKFMGKKWDYEVPKVELWKGVYRVLKPGAHILVACGTRTQHRMAVNIEDAGFEIRDVITWHYGSGFPKSLDVSKAIDAKIVGTNQKKQPQNREILSLEKKQGKGENTWNKYAGEAVISKPHADEAKQWDGWGTALKPSSEMWTLAYKRMDEETELLTIFGEIISFICQLKSFAKIAVFHSLLSQKESKGATYDFARWIAENKNNLQEGLKEAMDILQSGLEINLNWSIVLSWLNILDATLDRMNTFTISMKISLITDFQTLKSMGLENILQSIMLQSEMNPNGQSSDVYFVGSLFTNLFAKLHYTQDTDVQSGVKINKEQATEFWTLARKPLSEKTVAENVLKYGTAGINIDGCRISLEGEKPPTGSAKRVYASNQYTEDKIYGENKETSPLGRFPANLILDEFMGSELDKQSGISTSTSSDKRNGDNSKGNGGFVLADRKENMVRGHNDSGGASRFFYCAKASKSERNKGLRDFYWRRDSSVEYGFVRITKEEYEQLNESDRAFGNIHPTVKPVSLMKYLIKLVTPKDGVVIDMFAGSGTTGVAADELEIDYILIDKFKENCEMAEARIPKIKKQKDLFS